MTRERLIYWLGALTFVAAACSAPASAPPAAAPTTAPAAAPTSAPAAAAKPSPAASAVASAVASTAPAAGATTAPAAAPTGSPITVGVMDDVTGVGAIEGALMRISTELAVKRANDSGGINGHPVKVQYVDPKGDATQSQQLATQLAQQDNVDVLAGGIFSPECLGVQALAAKLQIVYVPLNGCATDALTAKSCDKYTFRIYPVGAQIDQPTFKYEVSSLGKEWAIIYPDYALGQSALATSEAALQANGAEYTTKIAIPLGEANVTPYVSKVPTDGSVNALYVTETGSDLARVMQVIQQFGINQKTSIVATLGKESYAGVYPDALSGAYIRGGRPSDGLPGNADDAKFMQDWIAVGKANSDITGPLGGVDHLTAGNNNGYNAYISMMALVYAMRQANFTGKADTEKLVSSFETLTVPQGPDFPDGNIIMNKDDHQGRITYYVLKINGQTEDVVQTFSADSLPMVGTCKIGG